jgi:hypothetical protein
MTMILSPKKDLNNKDKLLMCLAENNILSAQVLFNGKQDEGSITQIFLRGDDSHLVSGDGVELIISFSQGHWEEGKWVAPSPDQVMGLTDALVAFTEDVLEKEVPDWIGGAFGHVMFDLAAQTVTLKTTKLGCGAINTNIK